jgi:CheY-like chemotaxis protein
MNDPKPELNMLLVEPETLLRRTVALTARSLGMAHIHEAASTVSARELLREQRFDGAVISIDASGGHDLSLLDQLRQGRTISKSGIPVAVLASRCDGQLLESLRDLGVNRVILKPFRVRALLDTFSALETAHAPPDRKGL